MMDLRDIDPDTGEPYDAQPRLFTSDEPLDMTPLPDPLAPPGCPYGDRCEMSTPDARCGFWGVYRLDMQPGWVGCRVWHPWDPVMAEQVPA